VIGWVDVNPVLLDVFAACALDRTRQAEGFKAEWKDGPRGLIHVEQRQAILLKVTSVVGLGGDETRYSETIDGDVTTVRETQTGQRKVTLQIQAIVPEHTDEQWAMASMERIRMRLETPKISDQLEAVEVAVIDIGPSLPASFIDKGRLMSSATMDVVFGMVANEDDPIPANWIQYLVISSHVRDIDGTELPTGQQMVNVEVPTIP